MFHMLSMEHAAHLRAEEEDEAEYVTPDQHGHDGTHRAVNLIVIKIIQAPRENIFRRSPKQPADYSAWDGVADAYVSVREELVNDRKKSEGQHQASQCEHDLPKHTAHRREQTVILQLSGREVTGNLLQRQQYGCEQHGNR